MGGPPALRWRALGDCPVDPCIPSFCAYSHGVKAKLNVIMSTVVFSRFNLSLPKALGCAVDWHNTSFEWLLHKPTLKKL
jgi:hypothetical protein